MPYQPNFGTADNVSAAPELQVSTKTATVVVNGGGDNEGAGRVTLRTSAGIVVVAVALLWLSAYGLK